MHTEYWVSSVGESYHFDRCCELCKSHSQTIREKRGMDVAVKEVSFSSVWEADLNVERKEDTFTFATRCSHLINKSYDYQEEHPEVFDW